MDPKSTQTLDPKLKEAYDRVMGTTLPQTSPPPITEKPTAPMDPMTTHEPQNKPSAPPIHQTTQMPTPITTAPHISSGFVAPHEEKKPAVSGTLLIIAGVVFLIVYTLFWLKRFGIAIPFLP